MNDEAMRFEARDLRLFQLLMIAVVWQLFRDLPVVALPITLWLLWRAISPWRGEGSLQVDADGLTIAPPLLRRWFTWRRMHGLSRRRPWTQMLLAGSFLGVALSGALILGNRMYTEQAPREEAPVLLRLAETNARDQVWRAVEPSAMPALADFTVGGHWRGYESRLAAGQVYRVRVQRGLFGDVAIPPDAFRDAERVAP